MSPTLQALAATFDTTNMLIPMVLGDLSDEAARRRTRNGEGPSIAWSVGHMLAYRQMACAALGADVDGRFAEKFAQAGATDGSDYPSCVELLQNWEKVRAELGAALDGADEETAARVITGTHEEGSPNLTLPFFAFHEAYHMGALGAIRKELGYPGPAELVMARMAGA